MKLPSVRQYPKEIRLGDATYKIKFVRKIRGEGTTLGECDSSEQVIRIKLGQTLTETFNTFLHELLHAIEDERDIKLSHKAIYELERGLSDVLMQNF